MTLDNMAGITKGSYTGGDLFCKSQLITCNRVKECNGVCPFEDALQHADKTQTMNEQHIINHDRDWIIGCIEHDGFIHTHRFDKANQIILEALSAEAVQGWIPVSERLPNEDDEYLVARGEFIYVYSYGIPLMPMNERNRRRGWYESTSEGEFYMDVDAWMPLPKPYREDGEA